MRGWRWRGEATDAVSLDAAKVSAIVGTLDVWPEIRRLVISRERGDGSFAKPERVTCLS